MATPTGQLHINKCACIFSISILCKLTNLPVHLYLVLTYLVRFCPHKTFGYKKNLLDQMYLFFKAAWSDIFVITVSIFFQYKPIILES